MRRWLARAVATIIVIGSCLGLFGWKMWTGPMPSGDQPDAAVLLEIPPGMTLTAAADTLVARGLLRDRRIILLGARLTDQEKALRAGLYLLEPNLSPRELLAQLTSGRSVQIQVTIAEGLDAEETAAIMAEALDFSAADFLAFADSLVRSRALAGSLLSGTNSVARLDSILNVASLAGQRQFRWCEGYLAPDTYLFSTGTEASTAASHLVTTQFSRLESAFARADAEAAVFGSPHQLLTLASIVEAEARHQDERPLIAAVYSNRLRENWRLEADPTVAYFLRKRGKRIFFKDLEVDSPYNGYLKQGLPPGPIGNPGLASLLASAQPDMTCEAMFFVSDGQGGHVFSRTMKEHAEAVKNFRQGKAAERRGEKH
jgi:peptidoglycan lytic transglycosylase G